MPVKKYSISKHVFWQLIEDAYIVTETVRTLLSLGTLNTHEKRSLTIDAFERYVFSHIET